MTSLMVLFGNIIAKTGEVIPHLEIIRAQRQFLDPRINEKIGNQRNKLEKVKYITKVNDKK
jgi:hypothetical protein